MKRARKRERILFALGIFSIASAVIGTPLLALVTLKGWYSATVLLAIVVAHGIYGIPLYLSARKRAKFDIRCVEAILRMEGATLTDLARAAGLTDKAMASRIDKCISRGYITEKDVGERALLECKAEK